MDAPQPPSPSPSPSRLLWVLAGGLALVGLIGVATWAAKRPVTTPPVPADQEAAQAAPPEEVALPAELAPLAAQTGAILARFDAAARAEGFEGWPGLPVEVATRLKDPLQSRLFTNPRALLLLGPEPGRLDALVLVKQVQPKDPENPYLPMLVRHLESGPQFLRPWGPEDNTPWGISLGSAGDETWGWVEGKSQEHAGTAFEGLRVVRNEPGRFWLSQLDSDGIGIWFYGYQDRLALEVDDLEDAAGKPEHTAEEDIGDGIATVKRADFDKAKDLRTVWTRHLFEVDGRLYAAKEKDWTLWKQGPPAAPPKPTGKQP